VAYDAANGDVYVANLSSNTVSVIDGNTNTVTSTITGFFHPYGVAYDVANGDVYVGNSYSDTVSVIVPPMPAITHNSVGPGSTISTTVIMATPNTSGDTFAVQVTSTPPSAVGDGALLPGGATAYTSGTDISHVAVGDVVTLYEVKSGSVVADTSTTLIANNILGAIVTYDSNGASGTAPTDSNQYLTGTSVTLAGQGNLTKTGYTFVGWNTKADGTGTSYSAGNRITIGVSNITLYAQWTATPTGVPSGLSHTNLTQTGWTETWSPVPGATGYNVYLNSNKVGSTTQSVYSYNFSTEHPGTTYSVQVASLNAANQPSTLSSVDSVITAVYGRGPIPPDIIQESLTESAQVGQKFSITIHEIGGANPMKWSVTSGLLPTGMSLDDEGVISGTPTTAGTYTFTVKVTDANNLSSTQQLSLTVHGTPAPSTLTLPSSTEQSAVIGHTVDIQLQAIGGQAPYTWSVAGTLPQGISMNKTTGVLSGTTQQPGMYPVTVTVTDAQGATSQQTVTLDVLRNNEREVLWNGSEKNVPAIVQKEGTANTTYMPIWYVMQLLKPMAIRSTWYGNNWYMTRSNTADLSNIQSGSGNTGIYLNGTLVQMVNTVAQDDPSTNRLTVSVK
jgi:large repetitive protein